MLSAVCIPATRIHCFIQNTEIKFPVVIERGSHPFPFRTRQLSLSSPMILRGQLCGKVGRRRDKIYEGPRGKSRPFLFGAEQRAFVHSSSYRCLTTRHQPDSLSGQRSPWHSSFCWPFTQ